MKYMRDKLKGALEAHEDFHSGNECSVFVLSYRPDGSWHCTDTGPDSMPVDRPHVSGILGEVISELSQAGFVEH